jgi:DNA-binding winged helix-turn-helix (wHTH) protein
MADEASLNELPISDLRIVLEHKCVHYKNEIIYLSPRLLKAIDCIYRAAPYCVDRAKILQAVWGTKWRGVNDSNVDKTIGNLNEKLLRLGLEIRNEPRAGYRLTKIQEDVREAKNTYPEGEESRPPAKDFATTKSDHQSKVAVPNRSEDTSRVPLIEHLDFRECLIRLGCSRELLLTEEALVRHWVGQRVNEPLWRTEGPQLYDSLRGHGESEKACSAVDAFVQHLIYCCAPSHGGISSLYLSPRKISEAIRLLQGEIDEEHARDLSSEQQIIRIHDYLLRANRLVFLPARLLLGGVLPSRDDELFYFVGTFTFASDDRELAKVPGVLEALSSKSMDFAVTTFFGNPDPFVCPFLSFFGNLHQFPVTMNLSRKYLRFSSANATVLPMILSKSSVELRGIGTMRYRDDQYELHPLACGI